MPNLFRTQSSYPKPEAQANLVGRTHYVDDATLRFHKSRVLSTHIIDNGLLFALVESVAANPDGTGRGFRYVIFDVFGSVVGRVNLQDLYRTRAKATKAMWAALNAIDARGHTLEAIDRASRQYAEELHSLKVAAGL